ncbi:hypothetical protein COO60DRAFT_50429 [Scenedesmus sp. NREL 46B-D3]|nr:hypothetical protein COO60DRAFT_50429 [Scenedesmus sp. NREL 46B-D3]
MTESLRALGVGKQQYQQIAQQPRQNARLAAGDVQGVIERIRQDYQQAYFVTGVIDDSIYDPGCTFVDPTVQFSGLDLWKRNLQLLVPFLVEARIELMSISSMGRDSKGFEQIRAEWSLDTGLSLPWRPRVSILGSTIYTLNSDANQVVRHVEAWSVSAWQALLQIITPGPRE